MENKNICSMLFANNSGNNFFDKMYQLIYKNGVDLIHRRFPTALDEKLSYLLSFITYGLVGLIKEWFDTGMALDKNEMIKMAEAMLNALAECFLFLMTPENLRHIT